MTRWLIAPLLSLLLAAPLSAAESLRVGYVRVMDDAQVMLAQEAGLYEKYGLDAELIEFSSGTDLIKGIVGGQLDIGVLGFSNAFTWAGRGADLRIVGGAQRGYHALLAREDAGIDEVADLAGKSLASQKQGSTADIVLKGVTLADAGLSPDDLNIMGVAPSVAVQSLAGGRVDAAFLFEPYARIAQLQAPVKEIYEIGEVWPFPCMVVITSAETLESRRDVLWAAMDAQREAIDMLENSPEEAAPYITHYFVNDDVIEARDGSTVSSEEVIAQAIATNDFSAELTDDDIARMKELAEIMQDQGILDGEAAFDVDALLDLSWQEEREL
ncbi:ABC transporter substrate-binding protein [Halomonas sp. MCCC 1A17488]|uniref:ABC transporter substrate-binding protein n=1 Tax=Billgrantia sulfidoxydans TaxID=2733484 RepID=A0ABX7W0V9_9GAMM|nr:MULTISPECIES: ABC transporter substrate-binding protein [Halomonas]MCE8017087.1 ABC transporter substrate-binding protein [Halomonas sp. MCCC 1A17488]MCG3240420.1 ABC transporter substrate-binding protein [Halomonas sp. MCCC 1A17488]QPP49716.1 ABC transporter substrate-binding protein [Halomonas sp. SS10-MC5]QTP53327.1 ABC transporter substrate-binding protein [Halomonas sulfidoxydans]